MTLGRGAAGWCMSLRRAAAAEMPGAAAQKQVNADPTRGNGMGVARSGACRAYMHAGT